MSLPALKVTTDGDGRRLVRLGNVEMHGVSAVSVQTNGDGSVVATLTIPVVAADIARIGDHASVTRPAADMEPPELRCFGDPMPQEATHA